MCFDLVLYSIRLYLSGATAAVTTKLPGKKMVAALGCGKKFPAMLFYEIELTYVEFLLDYREIAAFQTDL
jgi:hypothetical protein